MSIRPDSWIRRMAREHGMIEPFEDAQVRQGTISYGLSSYGYDMRVADEFKIFTNVNSAIVDPKNFDERSFVNLQADVCIVPPNSFALARSVEYFRIPRNVMTLCVGKSTYARCFRGDTRVALVDGTAVTLEEMARRYDDGEVLWGYSIGAHGRIVVTLLEAPRFIGRDALLELELDNGEQVHCTPDHGFILRDGRIAQAHELRPGDSLMPLYRQLVRGYEAVYQPLNGHIYPTHRLADEWNVENGIYSDVPGTHRHHRDGDRRNNMPWNLERMEASEHIRLHNAKSYGEDFDPAEHSAAIRESLARRRADPAWREHFSRVQSERAKRFWSEEAYAEARAKLSETHVRNWTPERREEKAEAMRRWFSDPAHREATGERSRSAWSRASAERRAKQQEIARQIRIRPEITAETVEAALNEAGSIRGAARLLDCDRSVFRRFPGVVAQVHGRPKRNHRIVAVRELAGDHDVYCLTVPEAGNFALAAGIFVQNCGIITNVTPFEPEWEGYVTLEISNTTPLPARIYANEGIAQVIFFESDVPPDVSYADRKGKYQGQVGVTTPRL
ncbi:MAG: dCTP deaminase domain-containing protein [Longimicrobiaceae bacterium]